MIAVLVASGSASAQSQDAEQGASRAKAAVVSATTPHLEMRATLSNAEVAPGEPISIAIDITPKTGMHVYAPGGTYRAVAVRLQPNPFIRIHDLVYPESQTYFFEPLKEYALVYSNPFQLAFDITVGATTGQKGGSRTPSSLTLKGTLEYQACDDKYCYLPASVPLQWTVKIRR